VDEPPNENPETLEREDDAGGGSLLPTEPKADVVLAKVRPDDVGVPPSDEDDEKGAGDEDDADGAKLKPFVVDEEDEEPLLNENPPFPSFSMVSQYELRRVHYPNWHTRR
tara:strand:- start:810 stop:1139 length:330 start_codon:yes stop_codon:yes gene_type:complete